MIIFVIIDFLCLTHRCGDWKLYHNSSKYNLIIRFKNNNKNKNNSNNNNNNNKSHTLGSRRFTDDDVGGLDGDDDLGSDDVSDGLGKDDGSDNNDERCDGPFVVCLVDI